MHCLVRPAVSVQVLATTVYNQCYFSCDFLVIVIAKDHFSGFSVTVLVTAIFSVTITVNRYFSYSYSYFE